MKTYELNYIISSQLTSTEVEETAKEVESNIQSKEGVILRSEKPRAQTLSYPIKKMASGYFSVLDFQMPESEENKIKEIKENLERNNKVLRHLILIKKPAGQVKERRVRKPMFSISREMPGALPLAESKEKAKEKLDPEDLNKKLDEILNS